jgi:hypothetical protein
MQTHRKTHTQTHTHTHTHLSNGLLVDEKVLDVVLEEVGGQKVLL